MKKRTGYIKLSRDLLETPLWNDPFDLTLLIYCMLQASHAAYGALAQGQFCTSKTQIAQHLHWSRNALKKHLLHLSASGYLCVQEQGHRIIVTVPSLGDQESKQDTPRIQPTLHPAQNCTLFDQSPREKWLSDDRLPNQKPSPDDHSFQLDRSWRDPSAIDFCACHDQMTDHVVTTNKNKNKNLSQEQQRACAFEVFWQHYPRRMNRTEARKQFMTMDTPLPVLMHALEQAKASRQWQQENGRFIPSAARWLDGGWEQAADLDDSTPSEKSSEEGEDVWTI